MQARLQKNEKKRISPAAGLCEKTIWKFLLPRGTSSSKIKLITSSLGWIMQCIIKFYGHIIADTAVDELLS